MCQPCTEPSVKIWPTQLVYQAVRQLQVFYLAASTLEAHLTCNRIKRGPGSTKCEHGTIVNLQLYFVLFWIHGPDLLFFFHVMLARKDLRTRRRLVVSSSSYGS
jgi:hypothetical protein